MSDPRIHINPNEVPNKTFYSEDILGLWGLRRETAPSTLFLEKEGFEDFDHFQSWYDDGRVSEELWDKYKVLFEQDKNIREYAKSVQEWTEMQIKAIACIPILVEQVERLQEEVDQLLESE